jgi:hypothetical protein
VFGHATTQRPAVSSVQEALETMKVQCTRVGFRACNLVAARRNSLGSIGSLCLRSIGSLCLRQMRENRGPPRETHVSELHSSLSALTLLRDLNSQLRACHGQLGSLDSATVIDRHMLLMRQPLMVPMHNVHVYNAQSSVVLGVAYGCRWHKHHIVSSRHRMIHSQSVMPVRPVHSFVVSFFHTNR